MEDLIIFGAGGFGREVAWAVERINKVKPTWNLLGFMDDNDDIQGTAINGYDVLGKSSDVGKYPDSFFVCAVGAAKNKEKIVNSMKALNPDIKFGTVIDPTAEISDYVTIGEGSIICAHALITVNIEIGSHVIVDVDSTVGHDAVLNDYVMLYPSVNVSGNTNIGKAVQIGTGAQIIQGLNIGEYSIIGAGAVVVRDIPANCTAVGCPAKPIKYHK